MIVSLAVVGIGFSSPPASAAETRLPVATIEPFSSPGAIGVDQSTHDVYIADYGTSTIEKFDENGNPVNFSALGSNELGGFEFYAEEALQQIAVNSTSHDFYVADYGDGVIKAFQQSGEPFEFTAGPGAGSNELPQFSEVCGVAVDANGDIYMGDFGTGVHVYAPDGEELTSFEALTPCNLAVGGDGVVYVDRYPLGAVPGVEKWTPSEFPVTPSTTYSADGDLVKSATFGLAVDPATEDLYLDFGTRVGVYSGSGARLYEFGSGIEESEGVAIDATNDEAYASDAGTGMVQVYGAPVPLPTVTTGEVSGTTDHGVILHGSVSPEGHALTACVFEYGTTTAYNHTAPCSPPAGSIAASAGPEPVSATVPSGLNSGTIYHFRLVAESANGTSDGLDRVFTTAIGAPSVTSESVGSVGSTEATVSADIDPKGAPTAYWVEYGGAAAPYEHSTPVGGPIGTSGDDTQHTVTVQLEGLVPGASFHFRFVASSAVATIDGTDAAFSTYGPPPSFGSCGDEAFRSGPGSALPDCRAYEQASPVDKLGGSALWSQGVVQAAADRPGGGEAGVTFADNANLPTTGGASQPPSFIASRSSGGWRTDGLLPATEPGEEAHLLGWNEELTAGLSSIETGPAAGLYLSETATGEPPQRVLAYEFVENTQTALAAFAADPAHLIFERNAALVPGAIPGKQNLYDLDHGALSLVGMVPTSSATSCSGGACVPAPGGSFAGPYDWQSGGGNLSRGGALDSMFTLDTISADGRDVFFTEGGSGRLFVREDGTSTTQVSAPNKSVIDPNGEKAAAFVAANREGTKVFFLSCQKLTSDSTAVSTEGEATCSNTSTQGQDLYLYNAEASEGHRLTDLTVDHEAADAQGAQVIGVPGASADGSTIYFVATGRLTGEEENSNHEKAESEKDNLYAWTAGAGLRFVATLLPSDSPDWKAVTSEPVKASRVSAGGGLVFTSAKKLMSYESHGVGEIYRYAPGASGPNCASCNPTDAAPVGPASLQSTRRPTPLTPSSYKGFLTRNVSADGGRVFFETPDKLVSADVNGDRVCPEVGVKSAGLTPACTDVYEWEAAGEGSCSESSGSFSRQDDGCLYLISTGTSTEPSFFGDADEDGGNAFFFTEQQLVPQDRDQLYDVYDARVEGGLAAQHEAPAPACSGEGCRAPASLAPAQQSAGSSSFAGPGDVKAQQEKAKKKKHGKHHKKRRGRQKRHSKRQKRSHGNRRTGR